MTGATGAKRLAALRILAALFHLAGDCGLQLAAGVGASVGCHTLFGHPRALLGGAKVTRLDRSLNRGFFFLGMEQCDRGHIGDINVDVGAKLDAVAWD